VKPRGSLRAVALVAALVLALAACGDDDDDNDTSAGPGTTNAVPTSPDSRGSIDGQLVLGLLMPQSGDLSAIHDALTTPIDLAVKQINAAGGVLGKDVVTKERDDGTKADVASTSLDGLLATDKADVILGPASSTTTEGIIGKIQTNGVAECTGSNTAGSLSIEGGAADGLYFRTAPPDSLQGPALAQLVLDDGHSRVGILTRNDTYGTGFGNELERVLNEGGADVFVNAAYDPRAADFRADVQKVAGKDADAIIVIGFPDDGGKIIKEMIAQNVGPDDVQIYTADGMQSSKFFQGVDPSDPSAIEGIKGTAPAAAPAGVVHPFTAEYAKTGEDTIFSPYYYDCVLITALAAQAAGSDDPAKITEQVSQVSSGGTKCNTYAKCKELLDAGTDINYEGASGSVDLNSKHEPDYGVYDVWTYNAEGKSENVKGVDQIRTTAS
jgi:branched-chain amino acid transport system substrate-binding protein